MPQAVQQYDGRYTASCCCTSPSWVNFIADLHIPAILSALRRVVHSGEAADVTYRRTWCSCSLTYSLVYTHGQRFNSSPLHPSTFPSSKMEGLNATDNTGLETNVPGIDCVQQQYPTMLRIWTKGFCWVRSRTCRDVAVTEPLGRHDDNRGNARTTSRLNETPVPPRHSTSSFEYEYVC